MSDRTKTPRNGPAGQAFIDMWQTWYEKDLKPFFNVPQLGLTRYYKEHLNQSIDKFFQMQGVAVEFARLLLQPVQKSLWDAQNELFVSILSQAKDTQAEGAKPLYDKWIAEMEKRYMELFRSPEYVTSLNKTMESFNDFLISRQTVLEDLLKLMPVPTHSDMDGLYKELYELKKRVRDLEKTQVQK